MLPNDPLATGFARAYRRQKLLDKGEYDKSKGLLQNCFVGKKPF